VGQEGYKRRLSPAEQAAVDANLASGQRSALAEAQRDAYFGFSPAPVPDG
jgi:hypothetical protein